KTIPPSGNEEGYGRPSVHKVPRRLTALGFWNLLDAGRADHPLLVALYRADQRARHRPGSANRAPADRATSGRELRRKPTAKTTSQSRPDGPARPHGRRAKRGPYKATAGSSTCSIDSALIGSE